MIINLQSSGKYRWEFQPEGGSWRPIQVPFGGWRAQKLKCDAGVYRVSFRVPAEAKNQHVRLNFAAVNYGAEVFAGTREDQLSKVGSHVGGWMPFSADITGIAKPGELCHLRIEVKGREKYLHKQRYTVPVPAPWFPGLAEGIIRGVELEILPPVFVENIFVKTSVAKRQISVLATIRNTLKKPFAVRVACAFSGVAGQRFSYPALKTAKVLLEPGEIRTVVLGQVAWELGPRSYWWPNVPYRPKYRAVLHRAAVKILRGKATLHERAQTFGFKDFTFKGNAYFLNGVRCNLRGDNQQEANFGTDAYGLDPGFGPPRKGCAGWPGAVDNLLRLNFNVLRIHQVPATPYMLDVCDELGLMIVDETPIRGSEGKQDYAEGRDHFILAVRDMVLRDRNHPSIVLWSAANEMFWADQADHEIGMKLARVLQANAHELDGTRPVIFDGLMDIGRTSSTWSTTSAGSGVCRREAPRVPIDRTAKRKASGRSIMP